MDYKALGSRIRVERINLSLTQAELAEKVDVSTAYIGQIERGERKFSIETLVSIAEVLDLSIDDLLVDNFKSNVKPILKEMAILLENKSQEDISLAIDIVKSVFKRLGIT